MKKSLIFLFCLFVFNGSYSQLLRSEVYDFTIGDYYGIRHVSNQSGQLYDVVWKVQMYHILSKQLSLGGDTVTYSAQRQTYFPPINGSNPSLQIDTFQFSHVNLNAFYSPTDTDLTFGNSLLRYWFDDTTGCYAQYTSLSNSGYCPSVIDQAFNYRMEIDIKDSCLSNSVNMFLSDYKVFSHAGGPYGGKYFHEDPNFVKQLIYLDYVNHNGIECGSFPQYFLNLEEENQLNISISPNPCADQFSVTGIEAIKSFSIATSEGRIVDNVTLDALNHFDVSKLTSGIYFLRLIDNQDKSGMVSFIRQ